VHTAFQCLVTENKCVSVTGCSLNSCEDNSLRNTESFKIVGVVGVKNTVYPADWNGRMILVRCLLEIEGRETGIYKCYLGMKSRGLPIGCC
jgi:hypothetical protein